MLLLKLNNLVKGYGNRTLFCIPHLEVLDGDRIGLIGHNGTGKSTLLSIINGEMKADEGILEYKCEITFIKQSGETDLAEYEIQPGIFSPAYSPNPSGGEKTQTAIASAFSKQATLLLADEPTTNLDSPHIEILQKSLQAFKGALILVSHDRKLLDSVCNTVWEIENGELRIFPGNYSDWLIQKERERDFAQFEYVQYRKEKKRLETVAREVKQEAAKVGKPPKNMASSEWRLYKRTASIQQGHVSNRGRATESRLERIEEKKRPSNLPEIKMSLGSASPIPSKIAAKVTGLTVKYNSRIILDDVSFDIPTGKRIMLLGGNGEGKTTILNCLLQGEKDVYIAPTAKIGYFKQNHELLDLNLSVFENARMDSSLKDHDIRTILANLYIRGDDVFKKASVLSGGERAKVMFARLLASNINFLILDEPTNHIDLYTAEALEKLLLKWQGTMIVVTHDRRLIEQIGERIMILKNGKITVEDKVR